MRPFQIIAHLPGPRWSPGRPASEQTGIHRHLETLGAWLEDGRLVAAGPFLDDAGGGLAIVAFDSEEEALAAALADPAVSAGLVVPTVRPWLPGVAGVDLEPFDGYGSS
jgi:uncharacterized protein YciI